MQILADWLNSMYRCSANDSVKNGKNSKKKIGDSESENDDSKCTGGWMPREMILGSSSEKRLLHRTYFQNYRIIKKTFFLQ